MRPGCLFECIDHVINMERQMDEQTGEISPCRILINNLKKCENSHFYSILWQKMTLNDNGFTRFLVRICPRAKLLVFDPLPPITAILKH